ncbi:MAG: cysteine--tRNA ligase [Fimbriimonadales bacterium]|nr:cysteine--tRNA ligase [Fimbriimonadales bacterium]
MGLRLYNTLSRTLEDFQPRDEGKVSIYACGLTPQAPAHLGHMRGAVFMDVVRRWFRYLGYEVTYVQNFTDIDDKIIARAQEENLTPAEIAEKYSRMYLEDLTDLGVEPAKWVYVTQNIPVILEMVEKILKEGKAYVVDGDVYFRVQSAPSYGKLSRRKLSEMLAGARVEVDERKEHPMDFALWKAAKPGEPAWESPWGMGRPGWHIECSALSLKELGENFDIHAGGVDLVFPHHENEIAQAEAYLGRPTFARYWIHWGAVQLAERKMSKSEGNVMGAREAIESYGAGAVRLFLLGTGYRSPIEYTPQRLAEARRSFERIENALTKAEQIVGGAEEDGWLEEYRSAFEEALNDDFNTPAGIAILHEVVGKINEVLAEGPLGRLQELRSLLSTAHHLCGILGLRVGQKESTSALLKDLLNAVISWRNELRAKKEFALADKIREDLKALGIALEDGPDGTTWRRT